jgi:hypothetical protein
MHPDEPRKELWMYPHVVQFETRRQELERELRLIGERKQGRAGAAVAARTEAALHGANNHRGRLATQRNLELERELTIERTLP